MKCRIFGLLLWLICCELAMAQDLEPRRWSHLPMGMNIIGSGIVLTEGDILFDPDLRIDDATFESHTVGFSYIRSFEWLGRSNRIDIRVPLSTGRWEGIVNDEYTSVRRHGFNDPRIRFSMILYGAPPLKGKGLLKYFQSNPVRTSVGLGIGLTLPLGEYYSDRLINLGNNRFVIRPQLGVLHQRGSWQAEVTGTVSVYQDNDEFFSNSKLEQDPLWFVQGHIIRSFRRGMWASLSGGFSFGGKTYINGESSSNNDRTRYAALSFGMPISEQQNIKLAWVKAETNVLVGSSSNSLIFSWSINWRR